MPTLESPESGGPRIGLASCWLARRTLTALTTVDGAQRGGAIVRGRPWLHSSAARKQKNPMTRKSPCMRGPITLPKAPFRALGSEPGMCYLSRRMSLVPGHDSVSGTDDLPIRMSTVPKSE
jgi:hypothetical protein